MPEGDGENDHQEERLPQQQAGTLGIQENDNMQETFYNKGILINHSFTLINLVISIDFIKTLSNCMTVPHSKRSEILHYPHLLICLSTFSMFWPLAYSGGSVGCSSRNE